MIEEKFGEGFDNEQEKVRPMKHWSLDEIEALMGKITQGEWVVQWYSGEDMPNKIIIKDSKRTICESGIEELRPGDAEFIASAPSIIRQLIKERNAYRQICGNIMVVWPKGNRMWESIDEEANRLAGEQDGR